MKSVKDLTIAIGEREPLSPRCIRLAIENTCPRGEQCHTVTDDGPLVGIVFSACFDTTCDAKPEGWRVVRAPLQHELPYPDLPQQPTA